MNNFVEEMKRQYGEETKVEAIGEWDNGIVYRVTTPRMQIAGLCCGNPVEYLYKDGKSELLYGQRFREWFESITD